MRLRKVLLPGNPGLPPLASPARTMRRRVLYRIPAAREVRRIMVLQHLHFIGGTCLR
jgi:hypothetical protein